MRKTLLVCALFLSSAAFANVQMQTKTESGVAITLSGKSPVAIDQPIVMDGGYGRKAILGKDLELDRDCESLGLVVDQFTDGDALVAYCRNDSGPLVTFVANLVPPTCKEGVLAKGSKDHFVCRVHANNCTYDYNPYTWKELSVHPDDNNHGCN